VGWLAAAIVRIMAAAMKTPRILGEMCLIANGFVAIREKIDLDQ
jgi:hypothetical protein